MDRTEQRGCRQPLRPDDLEIEAHGHLPSEELRERVLREIAAFVGEAPQHDDMTMILLKIDEVQSSSTTTTTINAELAEIAE